MRSKKTVPKIEPILSEAELEAVAGEVAEFVVAQATLTDELNAKIVKLRQEYEEKLMALANDIAEGTDRIHAYVEAHPGFIPPGKKSRELLHAVIGYRTGTPKVTALKGWTLKTALEACLRYRPKWVRQTPSLDKEQIIADVPVGGEVESVGLTVVQEETFFVAPKLEEAANASKEIAA